MFKQLYSDDVLNEINKQTLQTLKMSDLYKKFLIKISTKTKLFKVDKCV